tara:strand:- start:2239 stop:2943 length:705 start_codon:yes stop_codon:yes gene_type:complete
MVNVNTVYQRVLALANKEQRGYITPQEFNLYANQAQMDIFEQYFYDINQFGRIKGNEKMYSDPIDILEEKIGAYLISKTLDNTSGSGAKNVFDIPDDSYRLSRLNLPTTRLKIEQLSYPKFMESRISPLTAPSLSRPICFVREGTIVVNPNTIHKISINYIRKPNPVKWTYTIINGKAIFNDSLVGFENFDLDPSEESKVVMKVLALAGITLKDTNLYQIGESKDIKKIQQEKQ